MDQQLRRRGVDRSSISLVMNNFLKVMWLSGWFFVLRFFVVVHSEKASNARRLWWQSEVCTGESLAITDYVTVDTWWNWRASECRAGHELISCDRPFQSKKLIHFKLSNLTPNVTSLARFFKKNSRKNSSPKSTNCCTMLCHRSACRQATMILRADTVRVRIHVGCHLFQI